MKPSKVREMGAEELETKERELQEQLFRLRVQQSIGQLDNAIKLRETRRDIARVKTVLKREAGVAMTDKKEPAGRRQERVGVVTTAKMEKTVVVAVERLVRHAFYRKTIRRTSTFMAHDELGAHAGDRVRIVETRPLSRHKRWRVTEILERATAEAAAVQG